MGKARKESSGTRPSLSHVQHSRARIQLRMCRNLLQSTLNFVPRITPPSQSLQIIQKAYNT